LFEYQQDTLYTNRIKPIISQETNKIPLQYFSAESSNQIALTEWQRMIGLVSWDLFNLPYYHNYH